jgi:hypothetical protein
VLLLRGVMDGTVAKSTTHIETTSVPMSSSRDRASQTWRSARRF